MTTLQKQQLSRLISFDPAARNLAGFINWDESETDEKAQYLIRWAETNYPHSAAIAAESETEC